MKVLLATGNHPRHNYLVRNLLENNLLYALITEEREIFTPVPPVELDLQTKHLYNIHFSKREEAEGLIFKSGSPDFENHLKIPGGTLNSQTCIDFLFKNKPDVVITAGTGILGQDFLKACPKEVWNIHGGLSPWYKGAITHFWPSYHLQPQYTGCTIHYVNSRIDAGAIIHQTPAVLEYGDGLHQLACRSLKEGYDKVIPLLSLLKRNRKVKAIQQKSTGKLWLKRDWNPQHLSLIYSVYDDRIVNEYLDGKLPQERPLLFQQNL